MEQLTLGQAARAMLAMRGMTGVMNLLATDKFTPSNTLEHRRTAYAAVVQASRHEQQDAYQRGLVNFVLRDLEVRRKDADGNWHTPHEYKTLEASALLALYHVYGQFDHPNIFDPSHYHSLDSILNVVINAVGDPHLFDDDHLRITLALRLIWQRAEDIATERTSSAMPALRLALNFIREAHPRPNGNVHYYIMKATAELFKYAQRRIEFMYKPEADALLHVLLASLPVSVQTGPTPLTNAEWWNQLKLIVFYAHAAGQMSDDRWDQFHKIDAQLVAAALDARSSTAEGKRRRVQD